ncbi:transcriptional repressor CTCFL-like isoform X2 [Bradysia coprophila]|uniref:transcriptional repressor CTCFL-like isoform X2 n=1 Tax=Bradysia coprophila TaxID=38358 RepID=UPI00187DAC11|nr:transcriptional repressor CTCFL-like isoform X2 [Bradysia coprophila]
MAERIRRKDFDQICRLCLVYASDKTDLFPLYISEANIPGFYGRFLKEFKESLPEVITACIGIEIDPSEKLPLRICSNCERQLIVSNQFRQTCLQSNEYLIKLLKTDEIDDFDTDDDVPPNSLEYPELIIVDKIKDEFKEEQMETDSSCDSVWVDNLSDNLQTETNVQDKIDDDEKPVLLSTDKDVIKKSATKRTKTIPLITPSTPIVPVDCNNSEKSQSNIDVPKSTVKYHYPKKQKMCTVCGIIVDRLRDHMRTHPDALEHKCTLCSKKYLTTKGLTKHIRHKHTEDSDQSSCEYEYYYNKRGERTVRKPVAKPHKWKRNVAKTQRNFGQRYITAKGIEKPEKKLKEPCNSICRIKCTTKITHSQREEIFKHFWSICDLTQKRAFLIRHIEMVIPKYRRSNGLRSLNHAYFFEVDAKRIQVCKTFFVRTLDISHVFIKTAIRKFNSEKGHLEGERRGKCRNIKK